MQKRRHIDYSQEVIGGSLESANSYNSVCSEVFQKGGGGKNQEFMLIRLLNARIWLDMVGVVISVKRASVKMSRWHIS